MAVNWHGRTSILNFGEQYGTSIVHVTIRKAIDNGSLAYEEHILQEGERLDTLAGKLYGDSSYWRILAAASGIGWQLQCVPGTVIKVPVLQEALKLIS